MTKTQANQNRAAMNNALDQALDCESLGIAAVRCCLETALAHAGALAKGEALEQRYEWRVNETRLALHAQGFNVGL
jgi:hypothetical protein